MRIFFKTALVLCGLLLGNPQVSAQQICDPQNPNNGDCQQAGFPGCYICGGVTAPTCVPDDTFCENISGGVVANDCRIAICIPGANPQTPDFSNLSGCDYVIDPSPTPIPQCFLCNDDTAPFDNHCPNGACEPGLGEDVSTCQEDCLAPGITPTPLPSQATQDLACEIVGITFPGPPYNLQNSGFCEDGNVCTTDTCLINGTCGHTDKGCSLDVSDLCCPVGCNPRPAGQLCANDTDCDVDCKEIECPIPTPTPTPPPVFAGCLEGGGGWGEKSGPGCGGAACSLNTAATAVPGFGLGLSVMAVFAFGAYRSLRRRGK